MKLLEYFKVRRKQKLAKRFTDDLCYHMTSVYNYLISNNSTVQKGDIIKEAVSLLESWERVSEHVFKNKQTAELIEIKREEGLKEVTKRILYTELNNMVNDIPAQKKALIQEAAASDVEEYFKSNSVKS